MIHRTKCFFLLDAAANLGTGTSKVRYQIRDITSHSSRIPKARLQRGNCET
jgi:hypothetical protein